MNDNLINQQGQSAGGTYGGNPEPEKDSAPAEKPLTIEDVNAAIVAVVQPFIDKLTESIKGGFATKGELNADLNNLNRYMAVLQSKIPSDDHIVLKAKKAVPVCLRNLDSGGAPRTGNVLMLAPAPAGTAGNADSCYFGDAKAMGIGFDWSKCFFGYKINGTTVTIMAGEVDRESIAQKDLTVADNDFIYIHASYALPPPPV